MIKYLFYFLLFLVSAFSQYNADGVAAIVGENVILKSDVAQNAQLLADQYGGNNEEGMGLFFEQSLELLINQNVVFDSAEKDTLVIVSDEEVSSALDRYVSGLVSRFGSEEELEREVGSHIRDFKRKLRDDVYKNLLFEKYQQFFVQNIDISRSEVVSFYHEYGDSLPHRAAATNYSLIEIPIVPGKEAKSGAVDLLSSLVDSLESGIDFSVLAKKYSDDPGSAFSGGELGYVRRGVLVKEFEEVAFELKINEISRPVRTSFGYHIIQLIDRQGEKINVRHILKNITPTEEDREVALTKVRSLYNFVKEQPDSFDSLAVIYSSDYSNRSGVFGFVDNVSIPDFIVENIGHLPANSLSYPFESEDGSLFLAYVHNLREKARPSLSNSWSYIESLALQYKTQELFSEKITELKSGIYIKIY